MFGVDYGSWRMWRHRGGQLRDQDSGSAPPERLMQAIWRHQRLQRNQLVTAQGDPLLVLHPGFWNRESGPDFRRAVIQLGAHSPVSGDVEVDQTARQWTGHHHDQNPAYRQVILRVVWDEGDAGPCPVLAIKNRLDAPLGELELWLCGENSELLPASFQGQCRPCLAQTDSSRLEEIMRQAARARFVSKARELQARARQTGWEQTLWEGLFRGLGYKHNGWPMKRLAELLPHIRELDACRRQSPMAWQARLLGLAGFLRRESPVSSPSSELYLAQIWDHWWRVQSELADFLLPSACWRLHGLRPANHPHRRLALAAHWLASGRLELDLEEWFQKPHPLPQHLSLLAQLLVPDTDPFWSRHWTLRSRACRQPQSLLGQPRITDLAMNTILPWFWIRAESAGNLSLRQWAEDLFFSWPAAEDNSVLRLARLRLLGSSRRNLFTRASQQQGLMQIVHDFCEQTNALCQDCPFPRHLAGLRSVQPTNPG